MPDYLLGLLTLPALAGTATVLYGLCWLADKAIHKLVIRLPANESPDSQILATVVMARAKRAYLIGIGDLAFGVFVGQQDRFGEPAAVYGAISKALTSSPDPSLRSEKWSRKPGE